MIAIPTVKTNQDHRFCNKILSNVDFNDTWPLRHEVDTRHLGTRYLKVGVDTRDLILNTSYYEIDTGYFKLDYRHVELDTTKDTRN